MNGTAIRKIAKEDIRSIRIHRNEVLSSPDAIRSRHKELEMACQLGNAEKGKVHITFMSENGPVEVYTTIWNVDGDYIVLKSGTLIPVRSILSIRV